MHIPVEERTLDKAFQLIDSLKRYRYRDLDDRRKEEDILIEDINKINERLDKIEESFGRSIEISPTGDADQHGGGRKKHKSKKKRSKKKRSKKKGSKKRGSKKKRSKKR